MITVIILQTSIMDMKENKATLKISHQVSKTIHIKAEQINFNKK